MFSTLRTFVRWSGSCVLLLALVCEGWEWSTGQFEPLSWLWIGAVFCTIFIFLQESTEDKPPGHWVSLAVLTWTLFVLSNSYEWLAGKQLSDSWAILAMAWSTLFICKEYCKGQAGAKTKPRQS